MRAAETKQVPGNYDQWLWSLSEDDRKAHFDQVKKIVATHIKKETA